MVRAEGLRVRGCILRAPSGGEPRTIEPGPLPHGFVSPLRTGCAWHAYRSAPAGLAAWAIRADREMYCSRLSVRPRSPAPPVRGGYVGCVPGFWMEQAHADEAPVVIDAFDDVSVQLELGDDGGREVNPGSV
jgi:hypothetical protein